ncbi:hypothetical protein [Bacillus sp. AFS031507]|uniref:hypothetical protein n=1 Tax=Bacillus sp. AFS031507 TaxID=2033496 RepID=UPI0011565A95|nr:hypothetical protein [Bacillus sp. AFS031507]
MILKKIVDEYEIIKGNLNEARMNFGNHHHLVTEYQNQLDDLCTRYFGVNKTNSKLKKEK